MIIKNNTAFICVHCGKDIPKAEKVSRNHCPECFCSLHIDIVPGDRNCICGGQMFPTGYIRKTSSVKIFFECIICYEKKANIAADDDAIGEIDIAIQTYKKKYFERN